MCGPADVRFRQVLLYCSVPVCLSFSVLLIVPVLSRDTLVVMVFLATLPQHRHRVKMTYRFIKMKLCHYKVQPDRFQNVAELIARYING